MKSNTKPSSSENTFNNEPRLAGDDGIEEEEEIPCEVCNYNENLFVFILDASLLHPVRYLYFSYISMR